MIGLGLILVAAELVTTTEIGTFTAAQIPGEGTPVVEIKVATVRLFSAPSQESELSELMRIEPPTVIPWRAGFTRTVHAGTLEIRSNALAKANIFGDIKHLSGTENWKDSIEVLFNQGERLEYLLYLGEGICVLRRERIVFATELCVSLFDSDSPAGLLSQPQYELWFDVAVGDAPAKWLMLEPGIAEWSCTEPYNCKEKLGR